MGSWDSLDLSWQLGIVLGALTLVTFTLGLIRLLVKKRRLAKHSRHQELEDGGTDDVIQLSNREPTEGELFGVKALEKGFYGGVAQSRPTTASTVEILHGVTTNMSGTTVTSDLNSTPPPKRLTLGFGSLSISKFDKIEPNCQKNEALVAKATNEASTTKTDKEFQPGPKLTLSPESKKEPAGKADHIAAQMRSPVGNVLTYEEPLSPSPDSSPCMSPAINGFPLSPAPIRSPGSSFGDNPTSPKSIAPTIPPRAARRLEASTFDKSNEELQRPTTRKGETDRATLSVLPNIAIPNTKPRPDSYQPTRGTGDRDSPTKDSPSDDSGAEEDEMPNKLSSPSRRHQTQELIPPSYLNKRLTTDSETLPTSTLAFTPPIPPSNHSRNTSSGSLKRIYDSIKVKHSKNSSLSKSTNPSKEKQEIERQRDQLYYDPKDHRRNRSGSIEGKFVDFDNRRESPFSDNQALSETIITTTLSTTNPPPSPAISTTSTTPTISVSRYRSDSESSMASISDLYNTYIKKSIMKPKIGEGEESGLFDLDLRTEFEKKEAERVERERNGLLSAAAAVGGQRKGRKERPERLDLDKEEGGRRVPRAIESPVSGWRI